MDLSFSKEELAFRDEVRAFFKDNVPASTRQKLQEGRHLSKQEMIDWWRILNKKGWGVSHWPKEYGGTGWSSVQHYIFNEELQMAPAPAPLAFGVSMVGPVIYTFGNEAQKKHYLPRIANVDDWWCQGFSEPGSGSDLASLKTKAERKGDKYIVNGQKTWTTLAQHADMIFNLCRTDPTAKKQSGISFILIDMKSKGITVRPIQTIDGGHEVNEVFFDDVEVPVENLVGEENKGWDYAKFLLGNERTGIARVGVSKERIRRIKELARKVESGGKPVFEDQKFREKLAEVEIELKALELTQLRVVADEGKHGKGKPNPASSVLKIKGSEIQQATTELLMEVIGPFAAPYDDPRRRRQQRGDGLDRADRAELFQQPQGLDLRRLQRDPAQHHHQGRAGAVNASAQSQRCRPRGARAGAGTQYAAAVGLTGSACDYCDPRLRGDDEGMSDDGGGNSIARSYFWRDGKMDFDLSEEQRLLKESVEGLLGNSYDFDAAQEIHGGEGRLEQKPVGQARRAGPARPALRRGRRRLRRRRGRDHDRDGGIGAGAGAGALPRDRGDRRRLPAPRRLGRAEGGAHPRRSSTAARPLRSRSWRRIRATICRTSPPQPRRRAVAG